MTFSVWVISLDEKAVYFACLLSALVWFVAVQGTVRLATITGLLGVLSWLNVRGVSLGFQINLALEIFHLCGAENTHIYILCGLTSGRLFALPGGLRKRFQKLWSLDPCPRWTPRKRLGEWDKFTAFFFLHFKLQITFSQLKARVFWLNTSYQSIDCFVWKIWAGNWSGPFFALRRDVREQYRADKQCDSPVVLPRINCS